MEKPKVYSEHMRGRGRHYFFNVLTAENGSIYLTVTESRQDKDKEGEYKQDRVMIFADDIDSFYATLGRTIERFHQYRLNGKDA